MEVWGRPPLDNELETTMSDFGKKELPEQESMEREHVYQAKYVDATLTDLGAYMKRLKAKHENLANAASRIWHEYDYLRMNLVPKKVEEMGLESPVPVKGIGKIKISTQMSCKTLDKGGLMTWFRDHDLDDMIQETINASTMKGFINEQIREGNEIPGDDLIEFTTYDVASIIKS